MLLKKLFLVTTGTKFHVFINQLASFKKMNSNPSHFSLAYLSFMDDNVILNVSNPMFLSVIF